jgi:Spy/CpxP family protein refolding chaperone
MARRTLNLGVGLMLAALLLGGAGPAAAEGGLDGMRKWWNSPGMVSQLKLTPAEKNSLDKLFLQFQRSRIEEKSKIAQARLDIEAAFEKEPLDEAGAKQAFHKVEEAKLARSRAVHVFMLEVRRLLGAQRYQKLKEFYKRHQSQTRK